MASRFGFEFIKEVKDAEFRANFGKLYDECLLIEDLMEKSPATCLMSIRTLNEQLVKHVYQRLVGSIVGDKSTYELLEDPKFKAAVNNPTLIDRSNQLRYDGNKATHRDEKSTLDAEMAAKSNVPTLAVVIQRFCEILDALPSVEEKKPYIKGQVSIGLVTEPTSSGGTLRYLQVSVRNCNVSQVSALRYKWYGTDSSNPLQRGCSSQYRLPPKASEKNYYCVVTSSETKGKLRSNSYHDGKPKENSGTKTDASTSADTPNGQSTQAAPEPPAAVRQKNTALQISVSLETGNPQPIAPQTSPTAEDSTADAKPAHVAVQNKGIQTVQQSDLSHPSAPRSPSKPLPLAKSVVFPLPLPDAPKLFDPINGLVHYFIRPNDEFALNSLELLGADAFLYRLLRQEGFERIAFLEIEHEDIQLNTYDVCSKNILSAAKLRQQFSWELKRALKSAEHKTAIVMPLSVLGESSSFRGEVVSAVNGIERDGNGGNILLLTATHRSGIVRCFDKTIGLHPWLTTALSEKENAEKIAEAVRELEERGMIVLADGYRADEIANLLLRKKLTGAPSALNDLPTSKVYELAGLLLEHCLQEKKHFEQIPYQNRRDGCIRQLNALLDNARVQEELIAAAGRLKPSGIGYSSRLGPLFLERIYHININRYKKTAPAPSPERVPPIRQKRLPKDLFKNLPPPYQPEEREAEALKPLMEPAVLYVRADQCCGTGFLIHPDGYALTCCHVVRNTRQIEARLRTIVSNDYVDIWYPCEVVYGEPACDMAVLKLCEPGSGASGPRAGKFPYLPMASEARQIVFDEKYIMPGFPLGEETANDMTILDGKIATSGSDRQRDQMNLERCILNGRAIEGNSGSPIISLKDSRVIGLLVGAIGGTQGLDFMRPIKYFWRDFLRNTSASK